MTAGDDQRREWLREGIVPSDYPEPVAADWPDLLKIVEERVKPERMKVNRKVRRHYWWRFGDRQPALYRAVAGLERVLAIPQTSNVQATVFLPPTMVFGHTLIVFPFATYASFTILQSRIHQIWSAFLGPTMKDDLRYTPSDCLETFPFPLTWETASDLEANGESYYAFRADLMVRAGEGLTKTYNRFHDPHEDSPEIATLRDSSLHAAIDRAVLDAYGWRDISTDCEFLLDHEIDEEAWGARKKPYRCRWPNEVRDEVLARLLELNAQRAAEEARSGKVATSARRKTERPSVSTIGRRASDPGAAEPRPLWGTSGD